MDDNKKKYTTNKTAGVLLFNDLTTADNVTGTDRKYEKTFNSGRLCATALYGVLGAAVGVFVL